MSIISRIENAEIRLETLEMDREVSKVSQDLASKGVGAYKFVYTNPDYYDHCLAARALFLGGAVDGQVDTSQLCKTVVFENVASSTGSGDVTDSKYYCVVVQYQAKIDVDLLRDFIQNMRRDPENRLSKKHFNFMLAPEEISDTLTGFKHNGVCPFGLKEESLPIIVCKRVVDAGPVIFVGGGHPRIKLCLSTKEFVSCPNVFCLGTISVPRVEAI